MLNFKFEEEEEILFYVCGKFLYGCNGVDFVNYKKRMGKKRRGCI